jgi:excisionase family DNA binding protein
MVICLQLNITLSDRGLIMETAVKRGYTMAEACGYLGGISRQSMYKILGDGDLSSYHIGVRVYFTKESLDKFIDDRIGIYPI